jgi:hypothetical protein
MKKLLVAPIALAMLTGMLGCEKPAAKAVANAMDDGLLVEAVDPATDVGPPPHAKPNPPVHLNPMGSKPKGYFQPHAGKPYSGGKHGPHAKYWAGHHHHGKYYLYGVYLSNWVGYTYRVWNGRWLYWSPEDYCWYRYDEMLNVFIPLNPNGTDAIDTAPPPPPPPPG